MSTSSVLSRRSVLGGAGAVMAAAVSGCAASAKQPSTSTESGNGGSVSVNEGTQITVLGSPGENPKAQLDAFTKKTNIKINFVEYTYDKLVSMLAANNAPDVVRGMGALDAPFLYYKKIAEPLDSYVEKSTLIKKEDLADVNNVWRFDGSKQGQGELMGLCKDYSSDCCLWINQDLVPGVKRGDVLTYDQVKKYALDATKVVGGRVEVYGWEFYNSKPHLQMFNSMLRTVDVEIFSPELDKIDLTSEQAVKAVQFLRDLIEAKATTSSFNKSSVDSYAMFASGRLAILQSGYWTQGMWADVKPELLKKFIMIPAPTMGTKQFSPVLSGTGYYITRASKKKEAAWQWLENYIAGEPAKARATSGWGVPALKSLMPMMPKTSELNKQTYEAQEAENAHFGVLSFTPYAKIDAITAILSKVLDAGITNHTDTADICKKMTDDVNALLSRGKNR